MSDLGNKEVMANNIKYYLHKNGISRKKLSTDLDIKYTTLSSWLQADSYPRIDKIEMMANYFGISKANLVEKRTADSTSQDEEDHNQADLDDDDTIFTFQGRPIPPEDLKIIRRLLKNDDDE